MSEKLWEMRGGKLGDILVHLGIITQEQLDEAMTTCDPEQRRLGEILVAKGFTTDAKILKAVSVRRGITYFLNFDGLIRADAVRLVPEAVARKHQIVPMRKADDSLMIGMSNPLDLEAVEAIERLTGLRIETVMTTAANLNRSLERAYAPQPERPVAPSTLKVERVGTVRPTPPKPPTEEDQSAVEAVNLALQEGLSRRASDIHVEMTETLVRVRYRVDGIMQDGRTFDKTVAHAFVARTKILAELDITETRQPQDGRIRLDHAGRGVDLRVSVLPTIHGEKIVFRVLDSSQGVKKLDELGLSPANQKSFSAAIQRPNGIILVTGPTGSGKTTTLYAALSELNDATRNIVTLEDPVEYRLDRLNQVEVNAKIGFTFAAGLRSVLRQDPNVILVGEIRDQETAEIAVQAAVTGHLVLSTIHTNDAAATIHRLLNMRIEPFLIAAALSGVMAQRLVRRLCDKCKRKHSLTRAEAEALGAAIRVGGSLFEPAGCGECTNGYKGRIPVHEWLDVSRAVRDMILGRASADTLRQQAESEGMVTLQGDAMDKASRGLTSLEEVIRVTQGH